MDRLTDRIQVARRAVDSFREVSGSPFPSTLYRDGAIKRFELAFETVWKASQRYVQDAGREPAGSPKSCIRACREDGILNEADAEAALNMVGDRNLAIHTYAEPLAVALAGRLAGHAVLLDRWLAALEGRVQKAGG